MVFSGAPFLFCFLPVVWLLHTAVRNRTLQNVILVIASLLFYAYGEPMFVLVMIASVIINYFFAIGISVSGKHGKLFLVFSIVFNLLMIGVFKYAAFFVGTINGITGSSFKVPDIALPIGISFFTFQAMSYVIDVYRDPSFVCKNPGKVLLYICFFPQLIAGPIVKYHDVYKFIDERNPGIDEMMRGSRRFVIGLSKKLLLANTVGAVADRVFALTEGSMSTPLAWIGAVCYTLQIFFDFSGYSDMAIGLGHMFGFTFLENFDHPYISSSMKMFWRRWHISLSTWFKEYLYIPLGGNRKGRLRTEINKLIVFFFTGLWHGASWNFVLWGMIHGVSVVAEDIIAPKQDKAWKKVIGWIYTMLIVILAFVLFRADSFGEAARMIRFMFAPDLGGAEAANLMAGILVPWNLFWFAVAVVLCMPVGGFLKAKLHGAGEMTEKRADAVAYVLTIILLLVCAVNIAGASYNPFIYFRF